jgi:hypothetical protein
MPTALPSSLLTLPISRQRWMAVRAAIAAAEAAVLALVPVVVIAIAATMIGRAYPPMASVEILRFALLRRISVLVPEHFLFFLAAGRLCRSKCRRNVALRCVHLSELFLFLVSSIQHEQVSERIRIP